MWYAPEPGCFVKAAASPSNTTSRKRWPSLRSWPRGECLPTWPITPISPVAPGSPPRGGQLSTHICADVLQGVQRETGHRPHAQGVGMHRGSRAGCHDTLHPFRPRWLAGVVASRAGVGVDEERVVAESLAGQHVRELLLKIVQIRHVTAGNGHHWVAAARG